MSGTTPGGNQAVQDHQPSPLPQGDLALAEILGIKASILPDQPEFIDRPRHQAKVVEVGAGIGRGQSLRQGGWGSMRVVRSGGNADILTGGAEMSVKALTI